jgi:YVTN family beta-propeller protein
MSVTLVSLKHYDEFSGTSGGGVDYLLGNIGDKITTELTFQVSWGTYSKSLVYSASGKTITRSDSGGSFMADGFKFGDTLTIAGASSNSGNKTITTITPTVITVSESLTDETVTSSLHGVTPITAIDYYYNLIENGSVDSYLSLVDNGINQKYTVSGLATSVTGTTTLMQVGTISKAWSQGDCYIKTVSFNSYKQILKVIHNHYIIAPFDTDVFDGTKCLKYIAKIDAKFTTLDPVIPHTSSFTQNNGNTGTYGEKFNTGVLANYRKTSITYRNASNEIITAPSYCEPTSVESIISYLNFDSGIDSNSFSSGTPIVLQLIYKDTDSADLQNTVTNYIYNTKFDRKKLFTGGSSVDGENVGTTSQGLKSITATLLSASSVKLNFTIDLATDFASILNSKPDSNRQFILSAAVCTNTTGSTSAMYRNTVLLDENSFQCSFVDDTLLTLPEGVKFFEYPNTDLRPFTDFNGWVEDGVISRCRFRLKTADNAVLNKLTVQILAQQDTFIPPNASTFSVGNNNQNMIVNPITNYIFLTSYSDDKIYIIDSSDNSIITSITGVTTNPALITYDSVRNNIWVVWLGQVFTKINCSTHTETGMGFFGTCEGIVYNSVNDRIYISYPLSNLVVMYDLDIDNAVGSISVTGASLSIFIESLNKMFISTTSNTVAIIDCATNTVSATLSVGTTPKNSAYNPINNYVYVACQGSNNVYRINALTNAIVGSPITVGTSPTGIAYNETTNQIFISCNVSDDIYVIDCDTDTVVGSPITVGDAPIGVTYNPLKGTIYVANSGGDSVTEITNAVEGEEEFILEDYVFNTTGIAPVNYVQPILLTGTTRGYRLVDGDRRNNIELKRSTDLDTANYSGFELNYPFKLRWEDWRTLLGVNSHFPLNNHDWQQYSKDSVWDVKHRLIFNVEDYAGDTHEYQHDSSIGIKDYDDAGQTVTFTCAITTFNEAGTNNFQGKISKVENTLVKALFTGNFSTMPTGTTSFYGILALDNDPIGGVTYTRIIGTDTARETDSPWLGLPTDTDYARKTINGTASVLIEAVIDYTKLDFSLEDYFITARLGFK